LYAPLSKGLLLSVIDEIQLDLTKQLSHTQIFGNEVELTETAGESGESCCQCRKCQLPPYQNRNQEYPSVHREKKVEIPEESGEARFRIAIKFPFYTLFYNHIPRV